MLAYTIFVQLQSLSFPHMLIGIMWICRLLFVCLFVCKFVTLYTVTDFSAGDKVSGVKFCTMVHGRPGHGISHFENFHCSSRSPKSDESAPVLKNMFFSKKGTVSNGRVSGHPGHPLDPPLSARITVGTGNPPLQLWTSMSSSSSQSCTNFK